MNDELDLNSIKKGVYKHFKGNNYRLIEIATHSESLEKMVVYQALYGNYSFWVRPLSMFFEKVQIKGQWVQRFEYIGD